MPPRKSMAKRKKPSSSKASAANVDDQLKTSELQLVEPDPNNSDYDPVENNDDEPYETDTVLNSATTVQVDDTKIISDNNNSLLVEDHDDEEVEEIAETDDEEVKEIAETVSAQESNVSKSPCKNKDAITVEDVGNGDIKDALETVAVNESEEAVTALISSENETPLAVEDESKENVDDDNEKNDDIVGDNVDSKGDEDASLIDNKINENIEIYVGKLDKATVEDDLVNVFQQFGELESTRIVRNHDTKKSKGFAFVRFASADQAMRALSELKDGVEACRFLS
nr:nucleotide-binding, alpha-beta plait [Tanacetum cinerariifolium]